MAPPTGPLRPIDSIVPRRSKGFGAKATNLAELSRAGFPVPRGFAMPASVADEVFAAVLPPEGRPGALLARAPTVSASELHRYAALVRDAPVAPELAAALTKARESLATTASGQATEDTVAELPLAVRSSSNREDLDLTSAAGLHETVLNVRGDAALLDAVRVCWASLFRPEVFAYFAAVGRAELDEDPSVGVVVQRMVQAEESGVLFTVNPLTGDAGEIVVNAVFGLGSTLAEGRVSPDTYRIDRASGALRDRVIGDKAVRAVANPDGGVRDEPLAPDERERPVCDQAFLDELAAVAARIEEHFGAPQDVEWARVGGELVVLQARPITGAGLVGPRRRFRRRRVLADRTRIVWSNVNVGEALPGVATPLTWSVLSSFSELGFRRAFGALGCKVPRDAELVGNFRGRIYLNLTEFTHIASQVPFLRPRTLLDLGGGGQVDRLELDLERHGQIGFFLRLPQTLARFLRENYRLGDRVDAFEDRFREERERWRGLDLPVLSPSALDRTLSDLQRLLDEAGSVMLTAYGNLLLAIIALRAVLRLVAGEGATLERGVLTGLEDVESAAPGLALWHVAEVARTDPEAQAQILSSDPDHLALGDLPDGPTRTGLEQFLRAYGYRGPREAELAEPRWAEDPTLLFAALQKHLRGELRRPVDLERRQLASREDAMAAIDRLVPPPARRPVRELQRLAQRLTRLRERLRARVTEVLGMFRALALDASRRIDLREPGTGRDAAFFLSLEELHGFLRGDLRTVGPLVRQRRSQHARDRALPDPPDTFVGYPPAAEEAFDAAGGTLRGLPASGGRVEALARVLRTPGQVREVQPGEVLVVPYADVGWSPLFPTAAALVTDLGGPLSHAAVVAREIGVPMVVNLRHATRVVATGDRVRVDGDAGVLEILEPAAGQERTGGGAPPGAGD
ncbi:MAG TPA: PEP/pyruvate-binding domain-containing protein [Polyangiaceae bacterium LLY-WYZ-14_1]|nr:PEP/pyruvate-binding domain-containing protein [Polyangiaceae bacterium LLY-WYZ-14_1]